jgi:putative restriction endonuclease
MAKKDLWTREQLLLALNLYHKIPFGQFDHRNFEVIKLAKLIGRTPSAVSRKLGNFASLDPYHQNRGVKGLGNAGKTTKDIWKEFYDNWSPLVLAQVMCNQKRNRL